MIRTYFVLVFFIVGNFLFGQDCFNYHKENCNPDKSKFTYDFNEQSVSFLFSSGESREIPILLYEAKDYRVTLCSDAIFDDVISFKIINADNKTIYDNSSNNFALNLEFANKKTQNVKFLVAAPEPSAGISDTIYYEGCIGILIEEMLSVKTGF